MQKKPLKGNQELSSFSSVDFEPKHTAEKINQQSAQKTGSEIAIIKPQDVIIQPDQNSKPKSLLKPNTNTKESIQSATKIASAKPNESIANPTNEMKSVSGTHAPKPKQNRFPKKPQTKMKTNSAIKSDANVDISGEVVVTNALLGAAIQKPTKPAKPTKSHLSASNKTQAPVANKTQAPAANKTQNLGIKPEPKRNSPRGKTASQINESRPNTPILPKKQTRKTTLKTPTNNFTGSIKIIPLGGLNEIGKNMTIYECNGDMFIVDCGLAFPDESMLGIDIVLPDFTFAINNADKIKGIVITHGHEDHIGGLAYFLKQLNVPVYATRLTIGLIEGKLKEHGILNKAKLNIIKARDTVKMGCMTVEFVGVNHSIPDAVAVVTHSPAGVIVQTGDFKIDYTPIEGDVIDLARFGELGSNGVLALLSDSTNAERPGSTMTERKVGQSFGTLFKRAEDKRIIIATFASNIHRVQQICDYAVKYKRKVAVSGRSMENVVSKAIELGYLHIPKGILVELEALKNYKPNQIVIITTGSQGEPLSALSRMSAGDHRQVTVGEGDFIIISATPIPGNEKFVGRVVNELMKLGAEVIYEKMYEVHVSGHACQDELKLMLSLVKPKFFIPVHGEYKHLVKHSELAVDMGISKKNIMLTEIGRVVELSQNSIKNDQTVPSGQVLVDGLGVGDVGSIVLRDRRHLSLDGLIIIVSSIDIATGNIVSGPDIVSRGFVYVREAEELIGSLKTVAKNILFDNVRPGNRDWSTIKGLIKDKVGQAVYQKTKRSPMILPIIMEI